MMVCCGVVEMVFKKLILLYSVSHPLRSGNVFVTCSQLQGTISAVPWRQIMRFNGEALRVQVTQSAILRFSMSCLGTEKRVNFLQYVIDSIHREVVDIA